MTSSRPPRLLSVGIFALLLSAGSVSVAQEVAGRVLMAIGEVSIDRSGNRIPAKKDTQVLVGDTVITGGSSNAQVRFQDGAIVAFRPNTEFKVAEFKYNGKPDGSEKASLNLVKGGVRAVTGAIGRGNRDNLKVDAVVATVGIRGTGFNIVLCDAACKAASPTAKEGLYAGVFEGRINVGNQAGSTSDLGVNRFAYVQDEKTAPLQLIAPPSFLKDSLESQVRIRPNVLALNSASENSNSLQNANATVKAPMTGGVATNLSADTVNTVPIALTRPQVANDYPARFFENDSGDGASGRAVFNPGSLYLRAAEYKPGTSPGGTGSDGTDNEIGLNRLITAVTYDDADTGYKVLSVNTTAYVIGSSYETKWREGGTSGGVVSWGRWTGDVKIGGYGDITLGENQGWHYIVGQISTFKFSEQLATLGSTRTMTLIGGTKPTELRDAALASAGWRLTGGELALNFNSRTLSGSLLHYYGDTAGYGNFNTTYSGSFADLSSTLNSYSTSTVKTSGSSPLCTVSCAGDLKLGFYGDQTNLHAGATYQFNTGSNGVVQGVAIYK